MHFLTRRTAVVGLLVVLVAAAFVLLRYEKRSDDAKRREVQARANTLKNELEERFKVGASQADVVPFLERYKRQYDDAKLIELFDNQTEYQIVVAEQPGGRWFCDSTESVVFSTYFKMGKLTGTRIAVWPHGCL